MSGSGGIQTSVNTLQTPGIPGDWCDSNPRYSVDAGPFGLVAGASGLSIGLFAWINNSQTLDSDGTPAQASNFGFGVPQGFVHRENQALITGFLADASNLIPAGYGVTLISGGGVWVKNDGPTQAQWGQKAFAYVATGKVAFAPAGTVFGGASATGSTITPETFSITGSIAPSGGGGQNQPSILNVTAVGSGTIVPGASISGTGIPTLPAPQIVAQLTGTPGGIGTYALNVGEITAASETIAGTYGLLTIGTATGVFGVGDLLTGSGVAAGTSITANVTGTGGTGGTMVVNNNTNVGSATITASLAVETTFFARSSGLPGESVKMSNQLTP